MHPLSGSDPKTLLRVLRRAGGAPPRHWLTLAGIGASVLGRTPFSAAEYLYVRARLREADPMPPPIFILGHWRSGTTHLYNIMSKGRFGFVPPLATGLPWDLMLLSELIRPLLERALPKTRFIDNIPVKPDSPQEDEIAIANMTDLSFYHAIYFPGAFDQFMQRGLFFDGCSEDEIEAWQGTFLYFLKKLYLHQNKRRLLIKNPVYTARLDMLQSILPTAKFVHIQRNPYEVFESMRNFYKKLFENLALQNFQHVDIDEVILQTYSRMMKALEQDAASIAPERYLDLRYEDLESDPIGLVKRIYDDLDIEGFDQARPAFERYLSTVTSYKKNTYRYTDEAAALVETNWAHFVTRGGYRRPGAPQAESAL